MSDGNIVHLSEDGRPLAALECIRIYVIRLDNYSKQTNYNNPSPPPLN